MSGANPKTPNFTHFIRNQTHPRNFCLLDSRGARFIYFTRCFSSETLKPLLKPPCTSWCVFASYVFVSKYLSEASLRFLQRDRENAVLQTVIACKTRNQHEHPLSRCTMGRPSYNRQAKIKFEEACNILLGTSYADKTYRHLNSFS